MAASLWGECAGYSMAGNEVLFMSGRA